ncbi:MAG: hypothetical protein K8I29_01565 [Alphaproteobacteria bacterium]|uniref:Uncharacterized protein n=1 Tax=Candidatus Nitrobium versatile TaxID=2884831 RepID=A0A953J264_9BACT|nr:hypothetical protein [Candidatus Nitrobium versatile]
MEKMRHLTIRISEQDHQAIKEIAEQKGLIFSDAARAVIKSGCSQMSETEQLENLRELTEKQLKYMHDLLRFAIKTDMVLHSALITKQYKTKEELENFYRPIMQDLEKRGFSKPLITKAVKEEN